MTATLGTQGTALTSTPSIDFDLTATHETVLVEWIQYLTLRELTLETVGDIKAEIDSTFGLYIEGEVEPENSVWQSTMWTLIDGYDEAIDIHRDMEVPDIFREAHDTTQNGLNNCSLGFHDLMDGAISGNTETYQVGVAHIQTCNERWAEGTQAVMSIWANAETNP